MTLSNYLMKYEVYNEAGELLCKGKIKAKKKESEFAAKAGFGAHIEKKYGTDCKLIILTCTKELDMGNFGDMFNPNKKDFGNMFGDIFK